MNRARSKRAKSKTRAKRAKGKAVAVAVPEPLRGARGLGFEVTERALAVHRLRRAGFRVDVIAERLGVSTRTVRRAIAVRNRLARRTLAVNVEADLRRDLDVLADDFGRIEAALAADPAPRDVALLTRARALNAKTRHEILADVGVRREVLPSPIDEETARRARLMSVEELDQELRARALIVARTVGGVAVIDGKAVEPDPSGWRGESHAARGELERGAGAEGEAAEGGTGASQP